MKKQTIALLLLITLFLTPITEAYAFTAKDEESMDRTLDTSKEPPKSMLESQKSFPKEKEKIERDAREKLTQDGHAKVIIDFKNKRAKRQALRKVDLEEGIDLEIITSFATEIQKSTAEKLAEMDAVNKIYASELIKFPKRPKGLTKTPRTFSNSNNPVPSPKINTKELIRRTDLPGVDSHYKERLGVNYLHSKGVKGDDITVAVIDTGINSSHPDLENQVTYEESFIDYDFDGEPDRSPNDDFGHGTHVAGIIAGTGAASKGHIQGVAPNASLWNLRVIGFTAFDAWIIKAIGKACRGDPDVISLSLGVRESVSGPLATAVRKAWNKYNKTVVIAGGNDEDYFSLLSPGAAPEVITVGASDKNDQLAYFSSKGFNLDKSAKPSVIAPGFYIPSTFTRKPYELMSGTSMAAPVVSGITALLLSSVNCSNWMIKTTLMETAKDIGLSPYAQGSGLVNPVAAWRLLKNKENSKSVPITYDVTPRKAVYRENNSVNISHSRTRFRRRFPGEGTIEFLNLPLLTFEIGDTTHWYPFSELRLVGVTSFGKSDRSKKRTIIYELMDPSSNVKVDFRIEVKSDSWIKERINVTLMGDNVRDPHIYHFLDVDIRDPYTDKAVFTSKKEIVVTEQSGWSDAAIAITMSNAPQSYDLFPNPRIDFYSLINSRLVEGKLKKRKKAKGNVLGVVGFQGESQYSLTIGWGENKENAKNHAENGLSTTLKGSPENCGIQKVITESYGEKGQEGSINVSIRNYDNESKPVKLSLYDNQTNRLLNSSEFTIEPHKTKDVVLSFTPPKNILRIRLNTTDSIPDDVYELPYQVLNFSSLENIVFHPNTFGSPLAVKYTGEQLNITARVISPLKMEHMRVNLTTWSTTSLKDSINVFHGKNISFPGQENFTISVNTNPLSLGNYSFSLGLWENASSLITREEYTFTLEGHLPSGVSISNVTTTEVSEFHFIYSDEDGVLEAGEPGNLNFTLNVQDSNNLQGYWGFINPLHGDFVPSYGKQTNATKKYLSIPIITNYKADQQSEYKLMIFIQDEGGAVLPVNTIIGELTIQPRTPTSNVDLNISSCTIKSSYKEETIRPKKETIVPGDILNLTFHTQNLGGSTAFEVFGILEIDNSSQGYLFDRPIEPGESKNISGLFYVPTDVSGTKEIRLYLQYYDVHSGGMDCKTFSLSLSFASLDPGKPDLDMSIQKKIHEATTPNSDGDGKFEEGEIGNLTVNIKSKEHHTRGVIVTFKQWMSEGSVGNWGYTKYIPFIEAGTSVSINLPIVGFEGKSFDILIQVTSFYYEKDGDTLEYAFTIEKQYHYDYNYGFERILPLPLWMILLPIALIIVISSILWWKKKKK